MTRCGVRVLATLGLAASALVACNSATTLTGGGSTAAVVTPTRVEVVTPSPCVGYGCGIPVPNCRGGAEEVGTYDPSQVAAVNDVGTDVESWAQELVGGGDTSGIPTPRNAVAYLVTRDGNDLTLLWYRSTDEGMFRNRYVACESALSSPSMS